MKGDFTRFTFRPEKHYTSVRMQQGRLQLDSDWNEQVDIENYLRQSQAVDTIGADNGVPTSGGDSEAPYRDGFKIRVPSNGTDLAIAPGHLYVNGTLCELEATLFDFQVSPPDSPQVTVSTLIIDGKKLENNQWVEIYADSNGKELTEKQLLQIIDINLQTLELKLSQPVKYSGKMRRLITYKSQPNLPNAEELKEGIYLAYIDVWQRHITTIEDPNIREVALNIPDTTTRTQTVWQLKLKKFEELITEVGGSDSDKGKLNEQFQKNKSKNDLNDPDWQSLIDQIWGKFITNRENRQPYLNACARLCSNPGNPTSVGVGYRRLENQLYRVEIHESVDAKPPTFKWSRDNGSVVSAIEKIQGNTITIRKSSQDAWNSSKTGQWIEILNDEMELKGLPGVLVPLLRVSDTKIEFNDSRIINGQIPANPTKVRRWDFDIQTAFNGAIPISSEWLELEAGIKVKFEQDSKYETGDYWLIPARSATNDIDWPNDGAGSGSQPLPQLSQGIQHSYCLLGLTEFTPSGFQPKIRDQRIVFPPLMRCLDKAGGIITGELEIQSNLYVTGKYQQQKNRYVDGKVGIGTTQPIARLHTQAAKFIPITGKITISGKTVSSAKINFKSELNAGDLIKIGQEERIITNVEEQSFTIDRELVITEAESFEYQQAIACLENSIGITQFVVLANGNTGIGTAIPDTKFNVEGDAKVTQNTYLATTSGNVTIGNISTLTEEKKLFIHGAIQTQTNQGNITLGAIQKTGTDFISILNIANNNKTVDIGFKNNCLNFNSEGLKSYNFDRNIGIGIQQPISRLHIKATEFVPGTGQIKVELLTDTKITGENTDFTNELHPGDLLKVGNVEAIITQIDGQSLKVNQDMAIATLTSFEYQQAIARLENSTGIPQFVVLANGNTGIGTAIPQTKLEINGTAKATKLEGNNLEINGLSILNGTLKLGNGETISAFSSDSTLNNNSAQSVPTAQTVKTYVDSKLEQKANLEGSLNQNFQANTLKANKLEGITLELNGVTINQVANNLSLPNNGEQAVPTSQAVKTYVDSELNKQTNLNRSLNQDLNVNTVKANRLEGITLKLNGITINEVDNNISSPNNGAQTIPTSQAVKTYVDTNISDLTNNLNSKANFDGNSAQDFNAKDIKADKLFAANVKTLNITSAKILTGDVQSSGFTQISSRTLKEEITDLSSHEVREIIEALNPVKFTYTEDAAKSLHAGFIAEDTPDLLTSDDKQGVRVLDVVAVVTKAVKEQQQTVNELMALVKEQQNNIEFLTKKVEELEKTNIANERLQDMLNVRPWFNLF
jgi:Family of unknown function (DUF6519)/Chaperone of endosialidase